MLTIAPLKLWSVRYYNDTSRAAVAASLDRQKAGGGLGEYYSEGETRAPVWMCAGDGEAAASLCGLSAADRAGGEADLDVVARWLDEGVAPGGACGRAFSARSNRGFDLTFCAPKSVSLLRALDTGGVASKAVTEAHNRALGEALEYLHTHAGYTRVHNPVSGMKDLVRLPGLVAAAYQHETSRAGDPHLHTHVLVPNKQARADGVLVAIDSDALWHEAKAAGIIYQATLRRELNTLLGVEWGRVDPHSGMAEIAGVPRETITAASQRSTQLSEWAAKNLVVDSAGVSAAQLARAQKATRPRKPEHRPWAELKAEWAGRFGGELVIDETAQQQAREQRLAAAEGTVMEWVNAAVAGIDQAAFTRADLIEALGAAMPVTITDTPHGPRWVAETLADAVGMRITAERAPHEREGHDRFTATPIIAEEQALYELIGGRDQRAALPAETVETVVEAAGLSADQGAAIGAIATSPWLIQALSAPAGAGKTTSLRALREAAHRGGKRRVMVAAPTGKAADVALAEGAGDVGGTIAGALKALREQRLQLDPETLLVIDEAGMAGTAALRELLAAASSAGTKTVLVGDGRQLSPVKARGGMFTQLCADLPWAQHLSEVWRMHDAGERAASLVIRDGDSGVLDDAVRWYRDHDRLRLGDPVAMAQDAFDAWMSDHNRDGGGDSLLIADRWEIADALNERIHRHLVADDAETVTGARRHRIGAGDVVISRRNDPTIEVSRRGSKRGELVAVTDAPVRNGQRWNVIAVDAEGDRIAARRIGDNALAVFDGEYLHTHVHHGYAVTVHAAQGATAARCHAVLATTGRRRAAYVAMTRGRESNTVYLYDRVAGEGDHEHSPQPQPGVHQARRGDDQDAAQALTELLGRDDTAHTVAATATATDREQLPEPVAGLLDSRAHALEKVRTVHELGVEVDWLAQIGGISARATCYKTGTATLKRLLDEEALDQDQCSVAAGIVGTIDTVQSLHFDTQTAAEKPALLAAVTACTRTEGVATVLLPATEQASHDALGYAGGAVVHSADTLLAEFDTLEPDTVKSRSRFCGAFVIVDDADHLQPDQLIRLAGHARTRGSKLVLVTTDTHPPRPGPARYLTDVAAVFLPWAHHRGTSIEEPDTAIGRAQHDRTRRGTDPRIAEMLDRATELINTSQQRYGYLGRHRDRSQDRSQDRSRDDDYGLGL